MSSVQVYEGDGVEPAVGQFAVGMAFDTGVGWVDWTETGWTSCEKPRMVSLGQALVISSRNFNGLMPSIWEIRANYAYRLGKTTVHWHKDCWRKPVMGQSWSQS